MKANQQLKALHKNVAAMFAAFTATTKTDAQDYRATVALLKSAPLNDAEIVKALRDDLFATFGESHKDAAQIRVNIINNARRVAFGGSKDGKQIRGKGVAAMLEVAASVESVRELKKALAENVPDGLKGESGGDRKTKGKGKGKGGKDNPLSVPKVATREQAFAAAVKILTFVAEKFTKVSETELNDSIKRTCELLTK